jgi:hypothetical protein
MAMYNWPNFLNDSQIRPLTGMKKPLGEVLKKDNKGEGMLTFGSGKWAWLGKKVE